MLNRTAYLFCSTKFDAWVADIQRSSLGSRSERLKTIAQEQFASPSSAAQYFLNQETRFSFLSDFDSQSNEGGRAFWTQLLVASSVGNPIQVGSHLTTQPFLADMLSEVGWNEVDIQHLVFGHPLCESLAEKLDWCEAPNTGRLNYEQARDFYHRLQVAAEHLPSLLSLPSVLVRSRAFQNALHDQSRNDAKLAFDLTINALNSAVVDHTDLIIAISD